MQAAHALPALPLAAAAAGLLYLAAARCRRLGWAALLLYTISVPGLALLACRLWDRHVGPDAFQAWQLALDPAALSFLVPLAALSPLLLWSVQESGAAGKENAASALACFAFGAALAGVLSRHLFLTAAAFALATWCMGSAAALKGREGARLLPCLFPLCAADLCLALGVLFLYLSDPARGLFFPSAPLDPTGMAAASCALMLAAALLRLGCFPFQRWMGGASRGGRHMRLHLLGVNLVLAAYLLFAVTRLLFVWEGAWVWICLGAAAAAAAEVARELLHARGGGETWGLLAACSAAAIAMVAAPGGQEAATAARLLMWAALPALWLAELGRARPPGGGWAAMLGGASLLGVPPLAGFAALWLGASSLASAFTGGHTVIFIAAVPLLFASAAIAGAVSLFVGEEEEEEARCRLAAPAAALLAACCVLVGLYPGTVADLFMREYGVPVEMPFASWAALGWAALACVGLAAAVSWARAVRAGGSAGADGGRAGRPLPLRAGGRQFPSAALGGKGLRAAALCGEALAYVAWLAVMVYLGVA